MHDRNADAEQQSRAEPPTEEVDQDEKDALEELWYLGYLEWQRRMLCPGCGESEGPY